MFTKEEYPSMSELLDRDHHQTEVQRLRRCLDLRQPEPADDAAIKAHAGWRSISAEERRMLIGMGHKGHNLEVECMPSECRGAIVAPVRRAVLCWKKACELGGIDPLSEKYSPKADPLDE